MLLSVIVTTYNLNKFADSTDDKEIIYKTLDSVTNQSLDHSEYEVIIVDDCSTDGTWEIVCDYVKKSTNVHAIQLLENSGGPSKPRNVGIALSRSDFVTFLDGDDYYGGEKALEKVANHIINNNFDLAYLKRFSADNRSVPRGSAHGNDLVMKNSDIIKHWMYAENAPGIKVIRRSLLADNNILFKEAIHWGEDKVFGLELLTIPGLKTNILNDYDYYYWRTSIEGQGMTAKKWSKEMYHQNAYEINRLLNEKISLNPDNTYLKELWYHFFSYEFRSLPLADEHLIRKILSTVTFDIEFSKFEKDVRNKVILAGKYGLSFLEIESFGKLSNLFKGGIQKISYHKSETEFYDIEYFPSLNLKLEGVFSVEKCMPSDKFVKFRVRPDLIIDKSEYENINMLAQTIIDSQTIDYYFQKKIDGFEIEFILDLSKLTVMEGPKSWWKLFFGFDEKIARANKKDFNESNEFLGLTFEALGAKWQLALHPKGYVDLHRYVVA